MADHPRIADHPDIIRGRAAAAAVKARGGAAMEAAFAFIDTAFDETARARTLAEREERQSYCDNCYGDNGPCACRWGAP